MDAPGNFPNAQGRLISPPARRRPRLYALLYLSEKFRPGARCGGKQVDELPLQRHAFGGPAAPDALQRTL
ncbi:MAG: DUF2087 domain-containing protein [Clostridiales bacterium]|nr:DUF2087 domain-containing protein [Clostridiales bacterium]